MYNNETVYTHYAYICTLKSQFSKTFYFHSISRLYLENEANMCLCTLYTMDIVYMYLFNKEQHCARSISVIILNTWISVRQTCWFVGCHRYMNIRLCGNSRFISLCFMCRMNVVVWVWCSPTIFIPEFLPLLLSVHIHPGVYQCIHPYGWVYRKYLYKKHMKSMGI